MQKGRRYMRYFDYSFLNNGLLPASLVNLTSNITALKTMVGVRKEDPLQTALTQWEAFCFAMDDLSKWRGWK